MADTEHSDPEIRHITATPEWTEVAQHHAVVAPRHLRDLFAEDPGRVEAFALDCHPWNGVLDLAFLTRREAEADPSLGDPDEMAAWEHFHFAEGLAAWAPATRLAAAMRGA